MPALREMPETIRRPLGKAAQEIWTKAHDSAIAAYDGSQRAYRTAYAAVKQMVETAGDQWEREQGKASIRTPQGRGPQRGRGGIQPPAATTPATTPTTRVDPDASKAQLMDMAKRLDVPGRSRMNKQELIRAIRQVNRRTQANRRNARRSR